MEKLKCPICKKGKLVYEEKEILIGLLRSQRYICNNEKCSAKFEIKNGNLRLASTKLINNETWKRYKFQVLTKREWNNIADGGMSDKEYEEERKKSKELFLKKVKGGDFKLNRLCILNYLF